MSANEKSFLIGVGGLLGILLGVVIFKKPECHCVVSTPTPEPIIE